LICQGFAVDALSQPAEALRLLDEYPYDLVIVEPALLGEEREGFFYRLRAAAFSTAAFHPVPGDGRTAKLWGFQRGVDDYMYKTLLPFRDDRPGAARGNRLRQPAHSLHPSNVLRVGDLLVDLVAGEVKNKKKVLSLRPKEYAILVYLMKTPPGRL